MVASFDHDEVKLQFLHPGGSSPYFSFPRQQYDLIVSSSQILMKVGFNTSTSRAHNISHEDALQATHLLCEFCKSTVQKNSYV